MLDLLALCSTADSFSDDCCPLLTSTMSEESKEEKQREMKRKLGVPMHLAQLRFRLAHPELPGVDLDAVREEAMELIVADGMA